jgi:inorganic pyrophosphatase
MSHPWHDIRQEGPIEERFSAWIEVPRGSRMKYEFDKETGFRRVGWVLFGTALCPANCGTIPQTCREDGDPLDVLVLGQEAAVPMCILTARAIGVLRTRDERGIDDKIIAVHVHEPAVRHYRDIRDIPPYTLIELKRFLEEYTHLEKRSIVVEEVVGPTAANAAIHAAMARYRALRDA